MLQLVAILSLLCYAEFSPSVDTTLRSDLEITNSPKTLQIERNYVRVLISGIGRTILVALKGDYLVKYDERSIECSRQNYHVRIGQNLSIDQIGSSLPTPLLFEPQSDTCRFTINEKTYRGTLLFIVNKGGKLITVNEISVEDYLKGVLPYEIGRRDSTYFEALKAQALVARTYTYSRLNNQRTDGFDLYDDVNDQVYNGTDKEFLLGNRAVDETKDLVVSCRDSLIQSFYFSTSPGKTANIEEMWPDRGFRSYLRSVDDSEFNESSPHYRWKEEWNRSELEHILHKTIPILFKGGGKGRLIDIAIIDTAECGRVKRLKITMSDRSYEILGDRVRWILTRKSAPSQILRSAYFRLDVTKRGGIILKVSANGGGFGHGIGLSQIGALNMAKSGYTAQAIIEKYYSGISIVKASFAQ